MSLFLAQFQWFISLGSAWILERCMASFWIPCLSFRQEMAYCVVFLFFNFFFFYACVGLRITFNFPFLFHSYNCMYFFCIKMVRVSFDLHVFHFSIVYMYMAVLYVLHSEYVYKLESCNYQFCSMSVFLNFTYQFKLGRLCLNRAINNVSHAINHEMLIFQLIGKLCM